MWRLSTTWTTGSGRKMTINLYVLTATVTVPAGTPATVTAGELGTGGAAGYGKSGTSAGYSVFPEVFTEGTAIELDSAGAVYAAITAVNANALRAWVPGQDDVSDAAISN
jgi:hypothetical protein